MTKFSLSFLLMTLVCFTVCADEAEVKKKEKPRKTLSIAIDLTPCWLANCSDTMFANECKRIVELLQKDEVVRLELLTQIPCEIPSNRTPLVDAYRAFVLGAVLTSNSRIVELIIRRDDRIDDRWLGSFMRAPGIHDVFLIDLPAVTAEGLLAATEIAEISHLGVSRCQQISEGKILEEVRLRVKSFNFNK